MYDQWSLIKILCEKYFDPIIIRFIIGRWSNVYTTVNNFRVHGAQGQSVRKYTGFMVVQKDFYGTILYLLLSMFITL